MRVAVILGVGLLCVSCFAGSPMPPPDLSEGVEIVDSRGITSFYERASAFYDRMARRRFNTLATYEDPTLRRYFQDTASFSDYYADLANQLAEAHFAKNRALELTVEEVLVDGPGRARVKVRIVGENALPLRLRRVILDREDRWERVGGEWWVVPGKL
jgi:hypothetical protein